MHVLLDLVHLLIYRGVVVNGFPLHLTAPDSPPCKVRSFKDLRYFFFYVDIQPVALEYKRRAVSKSVLSAGVR